MTKQSPLRNQSGQAIVELSLMAMFLLSMVLLGMIFISMYLSENVSAAEMVRHKMRVSMYQNARGPFKKNIKDKNVQVELPGIMKRIFQTPFLEAQHRIEFYEGAYTGKGKSLYVKKEPFRKIEL